MQANAINRGPRKGRQIVKKNEPLVGITQNTNMMLGLNLGIFMIPEPECTKNKPVDRNYHIFSQVC